MRPYPQADFDKCSTLQDTAVDHDDYRDEPVVTLDPAHDYDFKVLLTIALVTVPFLILAGIVVVFF